MRARARPDRLTCDFVKIFVDGVLDSTTAFMLDDYEGQPGNRGQPTDLVVLNGDIEAAATDAISMLKIWLTVCDGLVTHVHL